MDMKALAARLAKVQDKGSKGNWFRPNEEDQQIRILPYPHQEGNIPFIEVYFHYDIAGHRSICCPQKTLGEPCPICKLADEFKNMGGKENWYIFRDLDASRRTYSPVIIRGKEEEGIKLWGYGKTIYEQLMETCLEEGDITDVIEGHDLTVRSIPKGAPGNDSSYPKPVCKVQFKQTPALSSKKKLKELLTGMPNYLEDENTFKFMSYQELCDIVEKLDNEGTSTKERDYSKLPSDPDLEFPVKGKKKEEKEEVNVSNNAPKVTKDGSDLQNQLDDLLNG